MIAVHHLENSRSQRILWLLEELGLDYEVVRYERDPKTMLAPDELKQVHPLGKSPVIVDGQRTVAESGAIIDYLIHEHSDGTLAPPPGTEAYRRYVYWLHYAEASLMPWLLLKLVFDAMPGKLPLPLRPMGHVIGYGFKQRFLLPQLKRHMSYLESELAERQWFCGGDFTAADIQMSFPLEAATARGVLTADHPNLNTFLERIHARDAYRRALERGGP